MDAPGRPKVLRVDWREIAELQGKAGRTREDFAAVCRVSSSFFAYAEAMNVPLGRSIVERMAGILGVTVEWLCLTGARPLRPPVRRALPLEQTTSLGLGSSLGAALESVHAEHDYDRGRPRARGCKSDDG
jgi:hypothetical protein